MLRSRGDPQLYIVAGPNGSGKTTFAREYLPNFAKCREFVNVDLIASGLSPFSPSAAALEAGRLMLHRIHELAERHEDFGFETTLAGRTYLRLFRDLKKKGYRIHLVYLWLPSVTLAIQRVRDRVRGGGHGVPEQDIHRRFGRGLKNLFRQYRSLLDSWSLLDNSGEKPRPIAGEEHGQLRIVDQDLFQKVQEDLRTP